VKDHGVATSWGPSELAPLPDPGVEAILDLLGAWYEQRRFSLPASCEPALLWGHIERQGLGGVLGSLVCQGLAEIPEQAEPAKAHYFSNLLHHQRALRLCHRVRDHADRAGFSLVVVKGPVLAETAYHDGGLRPYSDVDVLVQTRDHAAELLQRLGIAGPVHVGGRGVVDRLWDPARIHVELDQIELEIVVVDSDAGDPMLDLVTGARELFFGNDDVVAGLPAPRPTAHLAFLMQHLARHFCSRLIWFLDIAAFVRAHRRQIDIDWIARRAAALEMRNTFSAITRFCRAHIDDGFPLLERGASGYNEPVQAAMVMPRHILRGDFQVFDRGRRRRAVRYLLSGLKYYVVADPRVRPARRPSMAAWWTSLRVLHGFQIRGRRAQRALARALDVLLLPLYPVVRLLFYVAALPRQEAS
jgi:hypothetical protein